MRYRVLLLAMFLGTIALANNVRPSVEAMTKIDQAVLEATEGGETAEFLVVLRDQADASHALRLAGKTERGRAVYQTMAAHASRTQAPLRAVLDARGATYRPYWVHNMIWVSGDWDTAQLLAARAEVVAVRANTWQRVDVPQPAAVAAPRTAAAVEWNIDRIGAPDVWAAGVTGAGVTIGGQDTGYDWEHPELKSRYRGWDGAAANHDYNWHDAIHSNNPLSAPGNPCGFDAPAPCDDNGHGTHTMGTMVGGTGANGIGVAPGARWIGCRNMEEGWGSPATYAECYEWFIAPYPAGGDPFSDGDPTKAPHVINNSWSCLPQEGCAAPDILRAVVEAVRAAGIMTVHSAGNSGPSCASIVTPAAIHDASFTVGATDDEDDIGGFSSRGPNPDGRRGPDVVAPGLSIRSSLPGGGYGTMSGTSMAAPHVVGLAALLISADPALAGDVDALETLITATAVSHTTNQRCGQDVANSVPNNVYGWGRIDALAAFEALEPITLEHGSFLPFLRNP